MCVFYMLLIVAIFRPVVSSAGENDGLHDVGAFGSSARKSMEDTLSDSVEISRQLANTDDDSGPLKTAIVGNKALYASRYIFKTKTGQKFREKALKLAAGSAKFATKLVPYASEFLDLVEGFVELFAEQPDWKAEFMKKILEKASEENFSEKLSEIEVFMESIRSDIRKANHTIWCLRDEYHKQHPTENPPHIPMEFQNKNIEKCKGVGVAIKLGHIHSNLKEYANRMAKRNSTYKRYALLGSPVLIELSLLASLVEPMAMELIWDVAVDPKISCLYRDTMIDHLPFVLADRFDKTNASLTYMHKVRSEKYNRDGYNPTSLKDCVRDCNKDDGNCLVDEFGAETFRKLMVKGQIDNCQIGYLQHLRHLVENMFPIDVLQKVCNEPLGEPTGYGWATIKLKNFKGNRLMHSTGKNAIIGQTYDCEFTASVKCDPYVKVFVNGVNVLTTDTVQGTADYNVGRMYFTPKTIDKSANITIEVWDDDSSEGENRTPENSQRMLWTSGTVESFMREPIRCISEIKTEGHLWELPEWRDKNDIEPICLEVDIIWQDERGTNSRR